MVIWTEFAKSELKNIYDYYKWNVDILVAKKIKNQIFECTKQLDIFPNAGTIDENLLTLGEFRYLVKGNYKIIYKYDKKIYITDVFDCRRDPEIMKEHITKNLWLL
jgi:plasmid stabilization system protein ParE